MEVTIDWIKKYLNKIGVRRWSQENFIIENIIEDHVNSNIIKYKISYKKQKFPCKYYHHELLKVSSSVIN